MQLTSFSILMMIISASLPAMEATTCGANFTATSTPTIISTPNYPNNHGNNLRCQWWISSSLKSVMLTINNLDTERCCDFLEVYDGSTKVGKFRGKSRTILPIVSGGTYLRLVFRSDSTVSNTGFQATFKEVNNCGSPKTALTSASHFSTPYYPDPHPHNLDCYWTITASGKRDKVELTILEGETDPCCDYISIYDGPKRIGNIKGNITSPRHFLSSGQTLGVYFHSNDAAARDGFRAVYQQYECGGVYQLSGSTSQVISSPNYPNSTGHHLNCTYYIKSEADYKIEITFNVDTESCCDYIRIFEGSKKIGQLSGKMTRTSLVSTGNSLRLWFHTDGTVKSKGFNATFSQVLLKCGTGSTIRATNSYQVITSLGFPGNYPNNYRCDWRITAPPKQQILLTFTQFVTESCCDFVQVFDGLTSIGKLKGEMNVPVNIVSSKQMLRIMFSTDSNTRKKGFYAKFKTTVNCGKTLVTSKTPKSVSTPNYPRDYGDFSNCMWTIRTPDHTQVIFNLTAMETEKDYDYLQVIDGINPIVKLDGLLRGPTSYKSTSGIMRLYFHSDGSATRDGFTGTYKQFCQRHINVTSSLTNYLASPNYPSYSPHKLDCLYYFNTVPGGRIRLQIVTFNTEPCCDYLKIFDGSSTSSQLKVKLKGLLRNPNNHIYSSNGTAMTLLYHTDGSGQSRGFRLTYQKI